MPLRPAEGQQVALSTGTPRSRQLTPSVFKVPQARQRARELHRIRAGQRTRLGGAPALLITDRFLSPHFLAIIATMVRSG